MNKVNLGNIKGEILIFGGPYSNLEALQSIKKVCDSENIKPSHVFCTGDIAGYCANPNECYDLINKWGIHAIGGNVDFNLKDESDECGCNYDEGGRCDIFSKQWYPFIQKHLKPSSLEFIHKLPEFIEFNLDGKKVFVLHGSYKNTSEFIFQSTPTSIKEDNFESCQSDIIIAGHCGIPFYEQIGNKYWVNAGVIGMPANDGAVDTWFATLKVVSDKVVVKFHQLAYDYTAASRKMEEHGLPKAYSKTLTNGIWDNCDVLPEVETNQQGISLRFSDYSKNENIVEP